MKKKILAMLLAVVMIMAMLPTAFAAVPSTSDEAQTSILLERSEKDGVDYFVSTPITLYEWWWGEYFEKEKISGYSVLSHETELTIANNADADDEGYLNVWLSRFSIADDGRYVSAGDNTYLTLANSGRFLSQMLDYEEYENAYENAGFVELKPGESFTFSLSGYETQYDIYGNEYGKYDILVVMAYFIDVSFSDSGPHVPHTWGEVHYAFVIDDEEAARMSQGSAEPTDPTEPEEPTEPEDPATSGVCGDDLTWSYSDGVLTIEGTGTMYDFIFDPDDPDTYDAPWRDYCWDINTVVIGDGVTSIGEFAFWVCGSLTSVTIPAGVTSVGVGAFNTCLSLTDINVASGNPAYTSVDGVLFNADQTLLHTYPAGKSASSYSIPDSVTTVGKYAFYEQVSLTGVIIPVSVTAIDASAFSECLNLADVYYNGSASQWDEIEILDGNDPLTGAEIHFAVTDPEPTEPTEPEEPTVTFSDVREDAWYAPAVGWAIEKGLVAGYEDGTFRPKTEMTRGAAYLLLANLDGTDVTGTDPWYRGAADWVKAEGYADGVNASGKITREQLFTLLYNYEKANGNITDVDRSVLDSFADKDDVSSESLDALAWAVGIGIVAGDDTGLNPHGVANRAMAITLFMGYCEKTGK